MIYLFLVVCMVPLYLLYLWRWDEKTTWPQSGTEYYNDKRIKAARERIKNKGEIFSFRQIWIRAVREAWHHAKQQN